jgi:hypothetical protein
MQRVCKKRIIQKWDITGKLPSFKIYIYYTLAVVMLTIYGGQV